MITLPELVIYAERATRHGRRADRAPRLATLAKILEKEFGYTCAIDEGFFSTDYRYKNSRLRRPGKGRYGNRLTVKSLGNTVMVHNSAETYRTNWDVVDWIVRKHREES